MSLNHSNSPTDEPEDLNAAEEPEAIEETADAAGNPLHHMTDKPGGEGGTAG